MSFFQIHQFSIFFTKISGFGPWINRINWCEGNQCDNLYGCQAVLKKVYLLLKCMHWSTDLVCTLKWLFWTFGYSKWPYLVRFINPTIGFASPKNFLDYAPATKPETALIKTALTGDPQYICSSKINIILIFLQNIYPWRKRNWTWRKNIWTWHLKILVPVSN